MADDRWRTCTLGVQIDAAFGAGIAGSTGAAIPMNVEGEEVRWYTSLVGVDVEGHPLNGPDTVPSVGVSAGASAGIELGFWHDKPSNLAGQYCGYEVEAGIIVGGGFGLYYEGELTSTTMFKPEGRFLGFQLVFGLGAELDLRIVKSGQTILNDV